MSKKNKSNKYDQKELDNLADILEEFLYIRCGYLIKEGVDPKEFKWAKETVEKAIKDARKGRGDKIFDPKRYEEVKNKLGRSEDDY